MGVNNFGQSGDLKEVYELNEIDLNSIVDRIARFILNKVCGCGEIGRHARFRFWWRNPWGFKSLQPHHYNMFRL